MGRDPFAPCLEPFILTPLNKNFVIHNVSSQQLDYCPFYLIVMLVKFNYIGDWEISTRIVREIKID